MIILPWFIVLVFQVPTFISFHAIRPLPTSTHLSAKAANDLFVCNECGVEHIKWVGRCTSCKEWNSVKPFRQAKLSPVDTPFSVRTKVASLKQSMTSNPVVHDAENKYNSAWFGSSTSSLGAATLIPLESVDLNRVVYRVPLFSDEMNRVLGGGLVRGSVTLLAGDPGIGKSTLLLQLASSIASSDSSTVVYMSGEENQEQITSRAQRLGLSMRSQSTYLICDVDVDNAMDMILRMPDGQPPALVIVDSIQTMRTGATTSGIGTVSQIRESAARFVELAKTTGTAVLLIGHVTKSGDIAGPRVLEHMVDTVLYLEGSEKAEFRLLRGVKNRFGSTSEVGVFVMTERGMEDCINPSALFMSPSVVEEGVEGCAVAVVMEGTRPLLAEIQGLVGEQSAAVAGGMTKMISPRRASDGFPIQRLLLLCAVIEKRLKLSLWSRDVYLNVVGGLRISEPASDLAVVVAVVSSLTGLRVQPGMAFVGEIGLAGEVRGVRASDLRVTEALKMGFTTVVVPATYRAVAGLNGGVKNGGMKNGEAKNGATKNVKHNDGVIGVNGVVPCRSITEVLVVALGVKNFTEIRNRLKKRFRSTREKSEQSKGQGLGPGLGLGSRLQERSNRGSDADDIDGFDSNDDDSVGSHRWEDENEEGDEGYVDDDEED